MNKRIFELDSSLQDLQESDLFPIDQQVPGGYMTKHLSGQQIIDKLLQIILPQVNVYYNNNEPTITQLGGINIGSTFNNLSMQEMWDLLLYPELFPTLTAPSATFTSSETGLREIGLLLNITFNSTFNRGSISPQYLSTSQFRSGLPNAYEYTGPNLTGIYNSVTLSDEQILNNYEVVIGNQTWQGRVLYDGGVQPITNKNNNFDLPLPAGNTNFINRTITGVYPIYATSNNITVLTKQALVAHTANTFDISLVADSLPNKQTIQIPDAFNAITGYQQFNTISNQWEWLNGSKAASLVHFNNNFTFSNIQINVNANALNVDYKQYIYSGPTIGARQLRFHTN